MTDDNMFESCARSADDLAAVFEYDGDSGHFYLYMTQDAQGQKIAGSIRVLTGMRDFEQEDVAIRWDENESHVGLFIRGKLWAVFDANTRAKYGGNYQVGMQPQIPAEAADCFTKEKRPEPQPGWQRNQKSFAEVSFFGEHDHPREYELKAELTKLLDKHWEVRAAYLPDVRVGGFDQIKFMLCIKTLYGHETSELLEAVGKIYASLYEKHEEMDTMFLDDKQEAAVLKACKPFYEKP